MNIDSKIKVMKWVAVVACFTFVIVLVSCGASRQEANNGDAIDLDELLGEEKSPESKPDSDEAEVLRLLGITPEETAAQQPLEEMPPDDLQQDVDKLKDELLDKDQQISELRSEVTQKEMLISDLEMASKEKPAPKPVIPAGRNGEPSPQFKNRYDHALSLFKARNYQQAITSFSELLASDPNNSLSDNCQYWIGESYYGLSNFNQAIVEFEKVFSFANTNKNDDAQLKLGLCYMQLGDRAQATAEFNQLLSAYPDSEYTSVARKYLSNL